MHGKFMNASRKGVTDLKAKKLTRKQKEALSAAGWDCTAYLWVRDVPKGMVLLDKSTGKTVVFEK